MRVVVATTTVLNTAIKSLFLQGKCKFFLCKPFNMKSRDQILLCAQGKLAGADKK